MKLNFEAYDVNKDGFINWEELYDEINKDVKLTESTEQEKKISERISPDFDDIPFSFVPQ